MPEPITLVSVGGGLLGLLVHLARRYFEATKEVLDIALGALALILALPVLILCAILIKISDRGPIFYTQIRVGRNGKPFKMYKLRTMYVDAEKHSGAVWARSGDPRVMPLTRWMRRSHVDELPQLINVIKGEMSLVGPRPERAEILAELEQHYPNVRERLAVKPGITGLAQVTNGYDTSIEDFNKKLSADLDYIHRRSWSLELHILTRTFAKFRDHAAH